MFIFFYISASCEKKRMLKDKTDTSDDDTDGNIL